MDPGAGSLWKKMTKRPCLPAGVFENEALPKANILNGWVDEGKIEIEHPLLHQIFSLPNGF
jgi:hypothetical protein